MMVLGIDPGLEGGLALYDSGTTRLVGVWPMPLRVHTMKTMRKLTEKQKANGESRKPKQRRVVDEMRLYEMIEGMHASGADVAIIEEIGKRAGEMGGVTAGYGAGLIWMACFAMKLRIEVVSAATWKAALRVPADKVEAVAKAELLFPLDREKFRTPRPNARSIVHDGWAEAAMLAMYGAKHL